jgi:muconolactone delta-isomerase
MRFLVRIVAHLHGGPAGEHIDRLNAAETARGIELMRSGAIEQIWRIDGPIRGNIGIWNVTDRRALDQLINSLPMRRYLSVAEVAMLQPHAVTQALAEDAELRTY